MKNARLKTRVQAWLHRLKSFFKRLDYRHYICAALTLGVFALIFCYPNALGRLVESLRDLGNSVAYAFCELFGIEHNITPTVTELQKIPFFAFSQPSAPSVPSTPSTPEVPLPSTWEQFKVKWFAYWRLWANGENFVNYLVLLLYILYILLEIALIATPIIILLSKAFERYLSKQNNDYDKDSKGVTAFKWFLFHLYFPVRKWITEFIAFVKEYSFWWKIWFFTLLFYFNAYAILVEFVAFYFYFLVDLNFAELYQQAYKLCIDLSPFFKTFPWWSLAIIGYFVFDGIRKNIGFDKLRNFEYRNRGFINALSLATLDVGTMGCGKTGMMTFEGLLALANQRDKAFEMLLECDLKFPYFPWINLENAIKRGMEEHTVYNLATTQEFIRDFADFFCEQPCPDRLFGYDYERFGATYHDGLKDVYVWDVIEEYAQLYFIYVVNSGLLSNYSVRTNEIICDVGNFPLRNTEFFQKDKRLKAAFERHSKILDFDSLRLGIKLANSEYADSIEFGVILITEGGKERGNAVENKGKRKDSFYANQLNDGFNSWLKMIRHSATVGGHPFIKVFMDEQRPESMGADVRELCEIVHIREKSERKRAMPLFALEEVLYELIFRKFDETYRQYRFSRGDNSLPMYLLKAFTAKIHHYYTGIWNTFGYRVLTVEIERGTQDGAVRQGKFYLPDEIYDCYSTDCFSDFFKKKALRSKYGIEDLPEYETTKASFEELKKQNSYFVNDLLAGLYDEDE